MSGKKFVYNQSELKLYVEETKRKGNVIKLAHLSSGEKQIVSLFSKLYLENEKDCILIIDEPELSISMKWQKMLLPDIMRSENCKLLLTVTHSPFIFENEFDTGEIISIDGFRGKVIEIGIRSTKLLDAAGNIKIINHSNIVNVVNLSRELSLAVVDCDFPYDVPIEYIEKLFEKKFEGIREKIPAIIEGPYYKGVTMYKDSNVTVKIVATCHEDDRFQVQRDLMREYRSILTEQGIDISYPQVVINQPSTKKPIKTTKKDKKDADEFVEDQRELSSDYEEQHQ